jgi:hypothetical protein
MSCYCDFVSRKAGGTLIQVRAQGNTSKESIESLIKRGSR